MWGGGRLCPLVEETAPVKRLFCSVVGGGRGGGGGGGVGGVARGFTGVEIGQYSKTSLGGRDPLTRGHPCSGDKFLGSTLPINLLDRLKLSDTETTENTEWINVLTIIIFPIPYNGTNHLSDTEICNFSNAL